jgi:hypothetical protein
MTSTATLIIATVFAVIIVVALYMIYNKPHEPTHPSVVVVPSKPQVITRHVPYAVPQYIPYPYGGWWGHRHYRRDPDVIINNNNVIPPPHILPNPPPHILPKPPSPPLPKPSKPPNKNIPVNPLQGKPLDKV